MGTKDLKMTRRGRLPKIIDVRMVETYAALGMTHDQIAASLGICRDTLYRRKRDQSDFSDAMARGLAKGIQLVATKCMEQINFGNFSAIKFYLETKAGWNSTVVVRVEDLDIQNMTADEIRSHLAGAYRQS
jgi:DNA-binding XRE family transcriptional regulator